MSADFDAEIAQRIKAKGKRLQGRGEALDDPVIAIIAEKLRLAAIIDNGNCSAEECDEAFKKSGDLDEAIIQNKLTTMAGAIASLVLLKDELETYFITDDGEDVAGAPLVRSLLDGALAVLQREEIAS